MSWRPSWPATLGSLGRLRGRLPVLSPRTGWLLYTLACFGLCVVLTFPSDLLLQRLVVSLARESAVRVRYAQGDLTWRAGWVLRDLTVEAPALGLTTVQLSRLTVQPSLFGLLFNQPLPLTFSADLYGGSLSGTLRRAAGGTRVRLALRRLALDLCPLPAPWGQGRVAGSVTADGEFLGNPAELSSLRGALTLNVTDGALRAGAAAGFPLPALQTLQGQLRATLAEGRVEVSELRLSADGAEARLQGGVVLRTPLVRSVLDLQLTTKVTGSPPPALATLISLLPASPGSAGERRASISGSLAAPVVR